LTDVVAGRLITKDGNENRCENETDEKIDECIHRIVHDVRALRIVLFELDRTAELFAIEAVGVDAKMARTEE
jgi:hypothetical protein